MCTSWILAVSLDGTTKQSSQRSFAEPPPEPRKPIENMFNFFAVLKAELIFSEFPDVVITTPCGYENSRMSKARIMDWQKEVTRRLSGGDVNVRM